MTTVMDARLMSLTLTDNRGFEADQRSGAGRRRRARSPLPRRGAVIQLALAGWKGARFFLKGLLP